MKGTRESLEQAIEEARGCEQGDLYREDDRYFFLVGGGTNSPRVWKDFWNTVQGLHKYGGDHEWGLDWLDEELTERGD